MSGVEGKCVDLSTNVFLSKFEFLKSKTSKRGHFLNKIYQEMTFDIFYMIKLNKNVP